MGSNNATRYSVRAPNGRVYNVSAPAGASRRQLANIVLQQDPNAGAPAPAQQPAPSAPSRPTQEGRSLRDQIVSNVSAGVRSLPRPVRFLLEQGAQAINPVNFLDPVVGAAVRTPELGLGYGLDVAGATGSSAVAVPRMIAGATAGIDSDAYRDLLGASEFVGGLRSDAGLAAAARGAQRRQEAEGTDFLNQVGAGIRSIGDDPTGAIGGGLGSLVGAAPAAVASLAAGAAGVSATIPVLVVGGVTGAFMGAGSVKEQIFNTVQSELQSMGVPEDRARAAALQAQAYGGENTGDIAIGALVGALANAVGVEGAPLVTATSRIASKLAGGRVSSEVIEQLASRAVMSRTGQAVRSGLNEGVTEGIQGGQEQYAANRALQNEGFLLNSVWDGVGSAAGMEGAVGALLGGGTGAISSGGAPRPAAPPGLDPLEEAAARNAVNARDATPTAAPAAPVKGSKRRAAAPAVPAEADAEAIPNPAFEAKVTEFMALGLPRDAAEGMAIEANIKPTIGPEPVDAASVGRTRGRSVLRSSARSGVVGATGAPAEPAAGDMGVSGEPAAVNVQGESPVDGALTAEPIARPRRAKPTAAAASETLAPVAEVAPAPTVAPTPVPTPPRTPRAAATAAPKPPAVAPATDDLTRAEAAALVTAPDVEKVIADYASAEGSLPNKITQFQARLQQASRTQTGMLDLLNEVKKETESLPKAAAPVRGPLRKFSFEDAPVATDATPSNPAAARAARRAVEPTATAEVAPVEPVVEPVVEPSVPVGDLRKSAPVKERAATYTAAAEKRAFLDGVAQQQALAQTGVEPVMPAAASENVRNAFKDGRQVAWGMGAKKAPVAAAPAAPEVAPTVAKAPLPAERRAAAATAPQPKAKPAAQVRAEAQVNKTDAELIAEFEAKRAAETKAAPKPAAEPKVKPAATKKATAPVVEQPRVVRDTPDVISEKHEAARDEVSDAEDRAEFRAAVKRARKANLLSDEAVEDINSDLQERGEDGLENARSTAVSALEDNESALIDEYEDDKANIMDTIIEDDLSDADKAALADHFGHKKYSKKTYGKFVDAVVDFVFNGVNAANAAIQSIINGAASAALAVGLVFNPMALSPPTGLVTKPEIVASLELRATVPTDAANSMSDAAERVYERMAPVATRANVGFMIMDKPNGELHLFRKDGSHIVSTPALSGLATGDEFSAARKEKFDYRTFADDERVTPAGVFTAKKGQQDGTRGQTSTGEQTQGLLLWLSQEGDAHLPVAIHTNYMPERQQYIDSASGADNAVSFGCISMDADFYADVFEADIDQFDRNLIFVMPNDTTRTEEFLPGVTEDVVVQAGGVQDQLSETPLQDDIPMAPPKQQARVQAQAQRRTGGRKKKPVSVPPKVKAAAAKATAETAKLQAAAKKAVDDPQATIDATANLTSALEAGKANNLENYVPLMKAAGTDIPVATHRMLLPLMTLDGIVDWVKDKLPPAERINVLIQKRTGQYAKYMEKAVELSEAMTSYFYRGGKEAFTDSAYHARLARVDLTLMADSLPDSILADPVIQHIDDKLKQRLTAEDRKELKDKRVIRAAVVTEAYKKWSKVDPEGRALYKKLVNYYSTMYAAMRYYTDKGIAALALPPKLTAEIRAAVEDAVNGGPDEPGVLVPASVYPKAYIPWRRYGEYSIRVGRVKNKLNRDAYADGAFAKYETAGERDAALEMLKNTLTDKDGKKLDPEAFVKRVKQRDSSEDLGDALETQDQLMGAMISAIKKIKEDLKDVEPSEVAKVANKLKQDLKNIYLRALPENSIFKQSMKARNVIGMDMDILKVFNSSARQYASLLTESGSRDGIKRELEAARALIDDNPDTKEQAFLNRTLDEIKTRAMAPPDEGLDNEVFNTLNRAGFQYFLTTPASAAAQWTVIPISVVPRLAARYGDIKANTLWAKYTATLATIKVKRNGKDLADGFTTPSMRDSKHVRDNPVLKRAFDALADRAVFETQSAAIMYTSKTLDSTSFADRLRRFGRKAETVSGFMFSTSDLLSKQMGAMMFFEAEYNKTKDFDKALEEAVRSSNLRAGNYTQAARPRIMQNALGRTLFLFKIFPVSVLRWQATMLAEMSKAYKSFDKSLDEDTKKTMRTEALEALRETVGSTLAGSFFHGVRGLAMFKALAAVTGVILKSALDDDDKRAIRAASPYRNILDTPDQWFIQDFLPSKFGAPQMLGLDGRMHSLADVLAYGIATELSGADIGSRTSLSDLLYREGKDAETPLGKGVEFLIANVAVLGMLERAGEGLGKLAAGETMYDRVEGATNVLPSNVSAMLKAALLGVQGVESRANKTVVDPRELNAVDIVSQLLGFQPSFVAKTRGAVYADVYVGGEGVRKANAAKAEAQGRLNRALTDRQGNRENVERALELIRKHNDRYPMGSATITEESLNNSYKAYVRANRESYRGQRISKRDLQYLPEAP